MVTLAIIVGVVCIYISMQIYDRYLKSSYIAKIVDGEKIDSNYVTPETQAVIDQLKKPSAMNIVRYTNSIKLSDGQSISYLTDSIRQFKLYSNLNYEPTETEWQILRKIVEKVYKGYVSTNLMNW